jgi:tRNA threonylcarbamoyladenosine biosynthesis protein TsaB
VLEESRYIQWNQEDREGCRLIWQSNCSRLTSQSDTLLSRGCAGRVREEADPFLATRSRIRGKVESPHVFPRMITLAIDTSDPRGSVALLKDGAVVARRTHDNTQDYSAWLLPAVDAALSEAKTKMEQLDLLAVSTGPGSFTGLRVGLTTVKAWGEVYGKRIVGVSRLEALAHCWEGSSDFVASCYDAQREQLFAGLYRNAPGTLARCGDELVISPEDFVRMVDEQAGNRSLAWITLDPEKLENLEAMKQRTASGDQIIRVSSELARMIGRRAEEEAAKGLFSDSLTLDANYVRRSDAEIFWKSKPGEAR